MLVVHPGICNRNHHSRSIVTIVPHGFTINIGISDFRASSCSVEVRDQNVLLLHQDDPVKH